MKKFFVELLKLSAFVGLALSAVYFTGNWNAMMNWLAEACGFMGGLVGNAKDHVAAVSQIAGSN
jgi:membrane associated rhomboid family serine protease